MEADELKIHDDQGSVVAVFSGEEFVSETGERPSTIPMPQKDSTTTTANCPTRLDARSFASNHRRHSRHFVAVDISDVRQCDWDLR